MRAFLVIMLISGLAANICHATPIAESIMDSDLPGEETEQPTKVTSDKGFPIPPFEIPAFLTPGKPQPIVQGNGSQNGGITGLNSHNNNTLISVAGPNNTAIASLTSTAFYSAAPISQNVSEVRPDGSTNLNTLQGFSITAQEETQAYAIGDEITFINNGGSHVAGYGQSAVDGLTNNSGGWSGWKSSEDQKIDQVANL